MVFATDQDNKCYACGKPFVNKSCKLVNVNHEDQNVYVGPDCFARIKSAGKRGYQPMKRGKKFGPKLYAIEE